MTEVDTHGFVAVPRLLTPAEVAKLHESLGDSQRAGRREVLRLPAIFQLATSAAVRSMVAAYTAGAPFAVRAIYFDKSPAVNWLVAWHQDLTIAVQAKRDAPGFGPWSTKAGVPHVQPPIEVLERMLTVRLHLDDADESNGALGVIPGSHLHGRLSASEIEQWRKQQAEVVCRT
jgi:ectoine hydroxylase-related dioxygenase (phytanoyl-CoA dioxygenase family)